MTTEARRIRVTGTVQGVGFRPFVYRCAVELGVAGSVANDSRGVTIEAQGLAEDLDELQRRLLEEAPPLARIDTIGVEALPVSPERSGFHIVDSRAEGAPAVAVSVDVATCDDCAAELVDPTDRRFRYPFVNCTNCGPRYTIILSIPYDREATTMAVFPMCDDCRKEYEDPANRRFHAEPNACPVCGPHLRLLGPDGDLRAERDDALEEAAAALEAGAVVAVKGLGGYHLAVDAGQPEAVAELRRRKARDDKPFALMVPDLETARRLCQLTPAAEEALSSPRRPIVLAPRAPGSEALVAERVAPRLPELGLMLPYTPLHHLLMARLGRPLVMTSGNLSDEPIAHDDADAVERLGPMVDLILTHNRAIHIRCDDSVVRATPSRVQMVRRSRGYAPEPVPLLAPARRQVLAVGAELKNTVAVAKGQNVVASHHIGDLEHLAAYRSFLQAVEHLCHLAGVAPDVIAHDLHPEYLSTKFAVEAELPTLAVQHHHAHVASCLVEHGVDHPVLGVAFDGLGMGPDGTLWGGEFLVCDLDGYRRVGHLRPVRLPGGNRAIREPWRMALSWAHTALGADAAAEYGKGADERWPVVLAMVERPETILTTSAGRLFDAVAALCGLRPRVTYEAQAAIELEAASAGVPLGDAPGWDVETNATDGLTVVDPSPLVARVVAERQRGTAVEDIAAGFHDGLGRAVAETAVALAARDGLDTVALSGGVFQNARLTEVVARRVAQAGLRVLVHRVLPPNDGAISVGQAAIAARIE
ncbi:MAG TPA: carbamoyltransferase HypF [Acidimicrobiales bacterium]|nr:carbamoyltransferase HypF [Acidimicrobiales bacterium]